MALPSVNSTHFAIDLCLMNYDSIHDYNTKPWIYGNIISGVVYGAIAILYVAYVGLMRRQYPKLDLLTRQAWMLLAYASLTFVLCTLAIASSLQKTVALVNYPMCSWDDTMSGMSTALPGGAGVVGNICFMLTSWTADALLIWRCLIIYHDLGRRKWLVVLFPLFLQVASIGLGSVFCYVLSFDRNDLYGFMIYYESITLAQNTILTTLIISRLLILRRRVQKALGSDFGYEYTNVAAMLTESQAMTLVAQSVMLAFICHDDFGSTGTMYQVLSQVQALAPMLIIFRVVQGKAWSSNTYAHITKSCSFGTV